MAACLETYLKGVLIFKPEIFRDFRGEYIETYNEHSYSQAIKEKLGQSAEGIHFVQDTMSRSSKHVLRGIHGDEKTWKLISCPEGRIYAVVINCDSDDSDFKRWQSFNICEEDMMQILVPPKFGIGHLVLSDRAVFQYKQSTYYDPNTLKQFTYRYDDSRFKIWWPVKSPILSRRDEEADTALAGR